ncbi:MAG: hypothetical protein JXE06_10765 [Coriobacteriia bacterium]|nr:hypothetical protein [Coriobacteriia bacterium]MBN2822278.1 hypothetical protein [Coriobacteriia bacterium]
MFPAWYALIVGVLIIAQWGFFLATGQVPELQSEPYRIAFHLVGEAITAIVLIGAGVGLLKRCLWGRSLALVAYGLLVYTMIVSPGYFAQSGDWPFVVMFVVLLTMAVVAIVRLLRTGE